MTPDACRRWIALCDRHALGERMNAADARALREHPASCATCGGEAARWDELEHLFDARRLRTGAGEPVQYPLGANRPLDDASFARGVLRAFSAASGDAAPTSGIAPRSPLPVIAPQLPAVAPLPAKRVEPPLRRRAAAIALPAAVAALAVAAGAVVMLRRHQNDAVTTAPPTLASARVTLASGDARLDERPLEAGMPLAAGATLATAGGSACLRIEPGIEACLSKATVVRIESLEPQSIALAAVEGRVAVALDPRPAGHTFAVTTAVGRVEAIGTAFSVHIGSEEPGGAPTVTARVGHGAVAVRSPDRTVRVAAGQGIRLGGEVPFALEQDEEAADRATLRPAEVWAGGPSSRLTVTAQAASIVLVDGVPLGAAPASMLIAPGSHTLEIEDDAGRRTREAIELAPDAVVTKRFEPTADAPDNSAPAEPQGSNAGRSGDRDTAAQMLSAARGLRAQGRLAEAAQAYRALQAAHPRSAEARASQVSLGDLDLSLGNPSRALRSFEVYLAGGGALAQEARYGRIRALQALGRNAQERAATEEFLRLYPDSVQARALRARSAR